MRLRSPYVSETVVAAVDGQIVAGLGQHDGQALEETDFWLLDAIFIGKGLASLGIAVGSRIVKSLARRAASRGTKFALAGPTRRVAVESIEALGNKATARAAYDPRTGMTQKHFKAFRRAQPRLST